MKRICTLAFVTTTGIIRLNSIKIGLFLACALLAGPLKAQILEKQTSISAEDVEIREILHELQEKAGVKFVYSSSAIPVSNKTSIHAADKKLGEVLDLILIPHQISYKVVNERILLFKAEQQAQSKPPTYFAEPAPQLRKAADDLRLVTGKVTDEKGKGIPGVNILLKGTYRGTISDKDGLFGLEIPDSITDGVLQFSFVGYLTAEVKINNQQTIHVSLQEDVAALDAVIVTGYQEIRKESFTGTAITVSGEELKQVNPLNILQSIQAYDPSFKITENNLAGSNPNRLPNITVRGATGLPGGGGEQLDNNTLSKNNLSNNPNQPTFILNGFEVSIQTVYDLDMNRVESVTLLKDAAATAVYGSRASNGVLVITTRAPEEGKLSFTYNYELSVTGPDLSDYNVLNAEDKLEYERLAGLYNSMLNGGNQTQETLDKIYYQKKKNVVSGVDTYWLSEPVETALGHTNSFTIEGGSNVLLYSLTGRYQDINGAMKESGRTRYGGDVFLSYNLNNRFLFQNNLSISEVKSRESPWGSFQNYVRMNPYYPKYDANGNILREVDSWVGREFDEENTHVIRTDLVLNPAYDATLSSYDQSRYTQIINSFSASWKIREGLNLRGLFSITSTQSAADRFKSPLSNEFYGYPAYDLHKRGEYIFRSNDETTLDGNMVLAYHRNLGKHFINATLGANVTDYISDYKGFTAIGFTSDKFDNIGFANQYAEHQSPQGSQTIERLMGSFFNVNYSMADRYLLDLAVRLDGSSKFGTENKYAPFWAAGIGWNLQNESFLASSSVVNRLKIRASTGLTGEVSFPAYMAKTTYEYYNEWYSSGVGARHKGYGNEFLKWQRTQNYDLGLEVSLFENRIFISPRYYYKLTKDLLADIVVPPSMGFASYKANLGKMENKGFELNMNAALVRTKNWFVRVHANMVRNENTIMEISQSLKKYNDEVDQKQEEEGNRGTPMTRFNEGESLNTLYGVRSLGIDPESGKEIYVKRDGSLTYKYSVKDIVPIGDSSPDAEGFFGGSLGFKNFLLTANFYTRFGGDTYNQTLVDRVENADPRYNVDQRVLAQRWQQPGDRAVYKDIANLDGSYVTSRFIQPDQVVELSSLNLSYELAAAAARKVRMQSLRLMVTMNDIWRWSAVEQERGIDYPFARSVTFSLQSRF
ncbi:SusC/RagA family TonB-linked outer membrane protein [Cesiribacter sp. SM1]|uniref:SusC/RagA family TonB-linked outer membrane protein n=1 Tax=Cesiribacter sp. SM1 TaxID=2861196 RepID=UPI001CD32312|nr:SusC/RagA family TonB-linked outer membrane protein [Cesiribacter sp. SM1]